MEEGKWQNIPRELIDTYRTPVVRVVEVQIEQFVTRHTADEMWTFLVGWKQFLQGPLATKLPGHPKIEPLKMYFGYTDLNPTIVEQFPDVIMLEHAGDAYAKAARCYMQREKREP